MMRVIVMKEKKKRFALMFFEPVAGKFGCLISDTLVDISMRYRADKPVIISVESLVETELRVQDKGAYYRAGSVTVLCQYFSKGEIGCFQPVVNVVMNTVVKRGSPG